MSTWHSRGPGDGYAINASGKVNEVTIHNVMHRLWMKLYRPLTVV